MNNSPKLNLDLMVEIAKNKGFTNRQFALSIEMTQPGFTAMVSRGSMETKHLLKAAEVLEMAPTNLLRQLMQTVLDIDKLAELGNERGLSTKALSKGVGIPHHEFMESVSKGNLSIQTLMHMAEMLEMTPDNLLRELVPNNGKPVPSEKKTQKSK
jgi:hypothetical protein